MVLSLSQSATAVAPQCPASFLGIGGTEPFTYYVAAGGAGGTINSSTGQYTGPINFKSNPLFNVDTIIVNDAVGNTAKSTILVGSPLILFCDIISNGLGIPRDRVYLWDQKIMQPTDYCLYVAVSVGFAKPFGNTNTYNSTTNNSDQFISMLVGLDIDIISRGPDARDRKEEVLLALNSVYSQQQQAANSFFVGTLSTNFLNLSEIDGTAIPYRFRISVNMQYAYQKSVPSQYYSDFSQVTPIVND